MRRLARIARRTARGALRYYFGLLFENPTGGFGVWFPDLPQCTAIGSSLEETRTEAAKSLTLHLAELTRHGVPIPEPSPIAAARQAPLADRGIGRRGPCRWRGGVLDRPPLDAAGAVPVAAERRRAAPPLTAPAILASASAAAPYAQASDCGVIVSYCCDNPGIPRIYSCSHSIS